MTPQRRYDVIGSGVGVARPDVVHEVRVVCSKPARPAGASRRS